MQGEMLRLDVVDTQRLRTRNRPSGRLDINLPLIQRAVAATSLLGGTPITGGSGSTDSNIPISMGIPSITIGRGGDGGGAHSLDEWWRNEDGHLAIEKALLIMVAEAGLAGVIP